MLYSEKELNKKLNAGCGVFYFYASEEALVQSAASRAEHFLMADDPETTVLAGPTPSVEEIVMAAGTISFFGGRRLVKMPLIRPSAYSDKDLQDICDTLADAENAVFLLTSVLEDKFGKIRPGKREQKLISACEKLGYCAQVTKPGRTELQKMLQGWAEEMGTCFTVTPDMVRALGTVTLDADTMDMVRSVAAGQTGKALQKLKVLLELQNDPILITGALIANYLDIYRVFLARRSRRQLADVAKDFGYTGKWQYRLGNAEKTAARFSRDKIEQSLSILQNLDLDLKRSKLDSDLLLQKALCQLALAGGRR